LNYALDSPSPIPDTPKTGFSCMICSTPRRTPPGMCYHRRLQTLRYFEQNHPGELDLYGVGWERGTDLFQATAPALHRVLRRLHLTSLFPATRHAAWKGAVADKTATLSRYRFAFCYENTCLTPGYITEKIFDAMIAGTVPVYLGHPDTPCHIPHGCYIDRTRFPSEAALYAHLAAMSDADTLAHLRAIRDFLATPASAAFSIPHFVRVVTAAFSFLS
ncbi:MAG: glycosyltransferase family 10, partial [Kiritimatiellaeota bacterium]|nr:glycosyltransferase family 10 [Kiritimatiellota bacterium]